MTIGRTCDKCGEDGYADRGAVCPECSGTLCRVVIPKPNARMVGWLCRDKSDDDRYPIAFVEDNGTLDDWKIHIEGHWDGYSGGIVESWTRKEWQATYGKLPRKGSKERVIIELVPHDG